MTPSAEMKEQILADLWASDWLKKAIVELDERDLWNAERDVELLEAYLNAKRQDLMESLHEGLD